MGKLSRDGSSLYSELLRNICFSLKLHFHFLVCKIHNQSKMTRINESRFLEQLLFLYKRDQQILYRKKNFEFKKVFSALKTLVILYSLTFLLEILKKSRNYPTEITPFRHPSTDTLQQTL